MGACSPFLYWCALTVLIGGYKTNHSTGLVSISNISEHPHRGKLTDHNHDHACAGAGAAAIGAVCCYC